MHSSKLKYIAFALTLAFTPLPTLAAGLGKLNVLSGLGEPLRADIELLSVTPEELSTISAAIASNEAYQNQGIEKPTSHNDIKIEVSKNARGVPVLNLKSSQPITDAFLDMLIQVDWSTGRLLREYTLLLDPPGYNAEIAETVQAPVSRSTPDAMPVKRDEVSQSTSTEPTAKAPLAKKSNRQQPKPEQDALTEMPALEGQEYMTQRGDTLAKIARDMKPEGVSLDQMLVGLYQANPSAFDGKNMNRLKVGQIIRAPSEDQLTSMTAKSASKQVRTHSANWHAYKNRLAGMVADSQPQDAEMVTQSSQGKVTTVEDKAAPAVSGPKDVVKLSAGDKVPDNLKPLQDKVNALQEESIAKDNAIREAESRAADLEKQVEDMKKLLALKSDAMAKIQQDAKATSGEAVAESAPVKTPEASLATEATTETPVTTTPAESSQSPTATTQQPSKPIPAPAAVDPFAVEEPSFIGGLTENLDIKTLGLGGAALALIGGGWLFLRNKRKKNLASFEEGIMTSGGLKANTVFGNTAGGTVDTGDTSFLTDFSQSTSGGMIDAHDVDPIAEAEVYMAYGRDAQAEEILKDAIVKEPKRYELHLKLLEIYQGNGNNSAFDAISGELYTTLGPTDPVWAKVAQLGIKLDPSNPLYAQAASAAISGVTPRESVTENKDALFASLEQSTTLDMPAAPEADPLTTLDDLLKAESAGNIDGLDVASASEIGSLDFDMTAPTLDDTPVISNADTVQPVVESVVLDAPSIFAEPIMDDTAVVAADLNDASKDGGLAFDMSDMNLGALDVETDKLTSEEFDVSKLDVPTIDFPSLEIDEDLPVFESKDVSGSKVESAATFDIDADKKLNEGSDSGLTQGYSGLDDEANKALAIDASPSSNFGFTEISLDLDENNEMTLPSLGANADEPEEVETKLDLVMAYLDMEDKIGAKELLEEVLKEGGENQRKRATELLEKIA